MTTTRGLFATLEAAPGKEDDLENLLVGARSIVEGEPDTTAWFALRMGHARGRRAHLTGKIPQRLALHGLPWLDGLPHMSFADVLADKGIAQ